MFYEQDIMRRKGYVETQIEDPFTLRALSCALPGEIRVLHRLPELE